MKNKPIIIGVTGGSGSGKTSVSRAIYNRFPDHSIMMLEHDSYYKDQSNISFEERLKTNYDHPFAFDTDLLKGFNKISISGSANIRLCGTYAQR